MEEGHKLVDAERCALWLLDEKTDELWTPVMSGAKEKDFIRLNKSQGFFFLIFYS